MKYRVDRMPLGDKVAPCGTNSILYLGNNYRNALTVLHSSKTGLSAWNEPNIDYGVCLSEWSGPEYRGEYKVKMCK